ncbi:MAG: MFS transporter [Actinobacteria bacterium]|nr:MFS transporter [Actinomycetota bacterium]
MSTWFSASAVVPQLRPLWRLSDAAAAWLTISVQLGFVVGALLSSTFNLADLVSARATMLIGATGAAACNIGLLVAGGSGSAIALRFGTGFFLAAVYPPAFKLMATWTRRARGTALGLLAGGIALGSAVPHLVNALGGLDWRLVVSVTSALTVLGGLVAFGLVREGPFPFPRATFDPRQIGKVFKNRGVRLASLGYFGHMWELFAMWAWFGTFFAARAAADPGLASESAPLATFAVIGIGAAGCWLGGVLGDRWARTLTTASMMAASGLCALVIGLLFEGPLWILLLVALAWGFTVIADSAQFSTLVTELADQAYVGTALTLQLAIGFLLTIITIWLIPELEDAFTWRWAFAFLAPGPAIGLIAMLRLKRLDAAPVH